MHATPTAKDFFLANGPSRFFPALAVANTGSCVGPQNEIGYPSGCSSRGECPRNMNRLKKNFFEYDLWYDDLLKLKIE